MVKLNDQPAVVLVDEPWTPPAGWRPVEAPPKPLWTSWHRHGPYGGTVWVRYPTDAFPGLA